MTTPIYKDTNLTLASRNRAIVTMRKRGETWRAIGAHFNISRQRALQLAGPGLLSPESAGKLKRRGPRGLTPPVTPDLLADIRGLLDTGHTYASICKSLNVGMQTISRARKENNGQ